MTKTIDNDVVEVLKQSQIRNNALFLPGQLDTKLYKRTNKVIELLGGKWTRGASAHVFPVDPEQGVQLAIMTRSVVDFKKLFQIFETPDPVADMLVEAASIEPHHRILEPSAGRGSLIRAVNRFLTGHRQPQVTVYYCEMHEPNVEHLIATFGNKPLCRDFLTLEWDLWFDRVIMNPPFRNGQDIQHVMKAYDHLKPGGRVVAVTYPGWQWRTEKKFQEFRDWLEKRNYDCDTLPKGSFSQSGTGIETLMLTIDK